MSAVQPVAATAAPAGELSFLAGGGEMGERIRAHPWAASSIGPPEHWPIPLRTAVRVMLTTNHPVFIFWGPESVSFYNDAYARSLGPEKHPAILGMPARQAWQEIWPIIGPQIVQVMNGGGATWHENQLVPIIRHGHLEDVYWTYSYGPLDDASAPFGVGGVLVLVTETTAQVVAEQRLRAEEARWRSLFDQAPGFLCVLGGPEHRFEYANTKYQELVSTTDLVGRTVAEALPEVVQQGFIDLLDRVFASGEPFTAYSAKVVLRRVPGAAPVTRYLDFVYQPIRDVAGTVTGILAQGEDVTERVEAEAGLRASENRFRVMADGVPVLIWVTDADGNIEFVNRGYTEFFGVTRDEIVARGWRPLVHPDDVAGYVGAYEAARVGRTRFHARTRVAHVSLGWRWIESIAQPRFAASGEYVGHVGISPDVTEVVDAQNALADADRRKDEFLATLAHELRNPLAPIRNATEILRNPEAGPETREWAVNVVDRQVRAMSHLLDDLLDIGRITRGKLTLSMQPVAARAVIDAAVETAMPLLDARRHRLTVSVQPERIEFVADALRLAQALSNLLTNAAKYTEPGGHIELGATVDAGSVVFSVVDNGIGLDPASTSQLFAMFGQVESALHRSQGGLGIGLALVKAIAELHDGTVGVHSDGPGRGSAFHIRVPLRPRPHAADSAADATPASPALPALTIVVADDNADASDSLAAMLMLQGHHVRTAYDGEEALATLLAVRPQVALLDIGMPGLNGYEVARRLRAQPWSDRVRLVAITGWGQDHDKENALAAGFDAHVTKPVDAGTLLSTLRTLAEGRTPE